MIVGHDHIYDDHIFVRWQAEGNEKAPGPRRVSTMS